MIIAHQDTPELVFNRATQTVQGINTVLSKTADILELQHDISTNITKAAQSITDIANALTEKFKKLQATMEKH